MLFSLNDVNVGVPYRLTATEGRFVQQDDQTLYQVLDDPVMSWVGGSSRTRTYDLTLIRRAL